MIFQHEPTQKHHNETNHLCAERVFFRLPMPLPASRMRDRQLQQKRSDKNYTQLFVNKVRKKTPCLGAGTVREHEPPTKQWRCDETRRMPVEYDETMPQSAYRRVRDFLVHISS